MSLQKQKMCEGCGLTVPHFGLASEGKWRWCSGCAKGHAGAVDVASKKCEGCGLEPPSGEPLWARRRVLYGICASRVVRIHVEASFITLTGVSALSARQASWGPSAAP